jgi:hypothetical protein
MARAPASTAIRQGSVSEVTGKGAKSKVVTWGTPFGLIPDPSFASLDVELGFGEFPSGPSIQAQIRAPKSWPIKMF